MRICFLGTYTVAPGYPVNRYLIQGLQEAGADLVECREELWEGFLHELFARARPGDLLRLLKRAVVRYPRLIWRYRKVGRHDCVIVGYPGYVDILLARLLNLFSRRLLVLIPFISLYDTIVVDRRKIARHSLKARLLKWLDRAAFACADLVLVDTEEMGRYYAALFDLPGEKFRRSFVGHEFDGALSRREGCGRGEIFRALFFGTYVPLHGVEAILEAAALLREEEEIEFRLIGRGQLFGEMREAAVEMGLDNLRFVDRWLEAEELAAEVASADVCLGIFGDTEKGSRVIPYKVFGALALGKPVITRDGPAIRELLRDGESVLLCSPGSGRELAAAIRRLRDDPELAVRIARNGYEKYCEVATPKALGKNLLSVLGDCLEQ